MEVSPQLALKHFMREHLDLRSIHQLLQQILDTNLIHGTHFFLLQSQQAQPILQTLS